jgi:hypothetical protein
VSQLEKYFAPSPPGDWERARCAKEFNWLDQGDTERKRSVCLACPVMEACLRWAKDMRPRTSVVGVWGGRYFGKDACRHQGRRDECPLCAQVPTAPCELGHFDWAPRGTGRNRCNECRRIYDSASSRRSRKQNKTLQQVTERSST